MTYHGQQQEDMYLDKMFGDKPEGLFIDVGAFDGVEFSNTCFFEQKGWNGVCVEPNLDTFGRLTSNRLCTCVWAQVGERMDEDAEFWVTDGGHLSSSDPTFHERWKHWYGGALAGWRESAAPMITLDHLFASQGYAAEAVDLVSIDVEGSEWQVMKEWNLKFWRPRVVVIEINELPVKEAIFQKFRAAGYTDCMKQSTNFFFCRDQRDVEVLVGIQSGRWP